KIGGNAWSGHLEGSYGQEPDYIFVPGNSAGYSGSYAGQQLGDEWWQPPSNTMWGVSLKFGDQVLASGNNLHGILFGDGQIKDVLGESGAETTRESDGFSTVTQFELTITADVVNVESEALDPLLTLTGIPAGATLLDSNGATISANPDG